jgi:hypothetical protein
MDYNFIMNLADHIPGYGGVWQGGAPDKDITKVETERPLVLVEMAAGVNALKWVRQGDLQAVLYFGIDDDPNGCLSDPVLLALARTCRTFLASACDVMFGCGAGVSRSSYADCATLMMTLNLPFDDALGLVRQGRPQANPNQGFVAQLRRLDGPLRQGWVTR